MPDKQELRRRLAAVRAATPPAARRDADEARTRALLAWPPLVAARVVAGHVALSTEPATADLLTALAARGVTVVLPRLRADGGLDLVVDDGSRVAGRRGTREPSGPAVAAAPDVWLVPALACDRRGVRLGRGGGSYDRALPAGAVAVALLHDGELLEVVPEEPHDRRVRFAALPSGVVELTG